MQTIKIRNLTSAEDNTLTDNSYLALALNDNDTKLGSEDPQNVNQRITVKTTISQLRKVILPTIGDSPPVSENEEGGIDVGIGDVLLDENGDALVPQPPVVIKQGGKDQIKITDDGISLKENVIIDKTLSVTGPTTFSNTTTFNRDVFFNELTNDPSPTEGKIYRKSDGLYFNGSKLLTEGQGGKWIDGDSSGDIVYNGGNVGIGIASPAGTLHIKSNTAELLFNYASAGYGGTVPSEMAATYTEKLHIGSVNSSNNPQVTASFLKDGNVGIGTTDPQEKLHVNGTVMLDDTPAPTTKTNKLYSVSSVLYWGDNRILTGGSGSTGSGGIAIADISGLQSALDNKLDKPAANSEPTFVDSDINLKTNISPIQSPIKSLESIRGVNFEWKEESNKSGEDQGLIAQEVEKIIPSAVKKGEDGYLKVDYTKLVPFLLEAVKDLSERVKELEKN